MYMCKKGELKQTTQRELETRTSRINAKLNKYMKLNNIKGVTIEMITEFVKAELIEDSVYGLYTNVQALNDVLSNRCVPINLKASDFVENVKFNPGKYLDQNEVKKICKAIENPQDKFIVYALWNGIMGKDYQNLINIKVSDVAEDFTHIMVNGRRFECDDYMQSILEVLSDTDTYYSENGKGDVSYKFNMKCPYLIKNKPRKDNDNGMNPVPSTIIKIKLQKLSKELEDEGVKLTGKSLQYSGLMFEMFLKEVHDVKEWDVASIQEFLNLKCISGAAYNLYRAYHQKYHEVKVSPGRLY